MSTNSQKHKVSGESSRESSIWNTPNIITIIRICLVPVFVVALLSPWPQWMGVNNYIDNNFKAIIAAIVFIVISATDWIDGYLARKNKQVTDFGKFLDPLADKILVAAALIALVELNVIPSWPVLIIIAREFIVSGVRMVASAKNVVIAASIFGKWKTVLQIIAIVLFIVKDSLYLPNATAAFTNPLYLLSWAVMIAALVMTILSMIDYIAKARDLLFSSTTKNCSEAADTYKTDTECSTQDITNKISELSKAIVDLATAKGKTIACAESLTGGLISSSITSVPGSSAVFLGGFVTYAISVKEDVLYVNEELLDERGAVDPEVAEQMAVGAHVNTNADITVAVTGIAGPGGEEPEKPAGTVFFGVYCKETVSSKRMHFNGDRECVRLQTTLYALNLLKDCLEN